MEEIESISDEFVPKNVKEPSFSSKIWNLFKNPFFIIFFVGLLFFIFHPTIFNLSFYFYKNEQKIPMNYVSNFYLWTRNKETPENIIVGDRDVLSSSNFRNRKTYLIIHGFTGTGLDNWIPHMKNALLWREDCNVISADWLSGSLTAGYYVIKARAPSVGQDVASLITFLRSAGGLPSSNIHVIGHSLGAHIAGYAGKHLGNASTIGRITGLDPAGLGFNGAPADERLDRGDASFVDVIHTHGCYAVLGRYTDCYGTHDNIGHADFWPNGGEYQPACEPDGRGEIAVRNGSNCHHGMAYVYFTHSVFFHRTSTRFLARECASWELFNNGSCDCCLKGRRSQYMGLNAYPGTEGVFYLNTSKMEPFGLLEPDCSPAEYSSFRILGVSVCLIMVIFWTFHLMIWAASVIIKKEMKFSYEDWFLDKSTSVCDYFSAKGWSFKKNLKSVKKIE